jgi:hypothetical protein
MDEERDRLVAELFRLKQEGSRLRREYEVLMKRFLLVQQRLRELRSDREKARQS